MANVTGMAGSWKTTVAGILAIATAVFAAVQLLLDGNPNTNPDLTTTISAIMAGLGLIFARDNNVSSEQAGVKPPTP